MFIIWGTKVRRRRLGYRADFCRLCRRIRPFKVEQVESVGHLYYIPLGAATIHGHIKSCEQCGIGVDANLADATDCSKKRGNDPEELIARNRSQIEEQWATRFELEDRVKSRKLTNSERETLILEPFALLNPDLQKRTSEIHFDKVSTGALLATIVIPVGILMVGARPLHVSDDTFTQIVLLVAGVLGVMTIWALATDKARFGRRKIVPKLAAALVPLDPSPDEIDQALAKLKKMGWAIGKKCKTADIMSAIQTHVPLE